MEDQRSGGAKYEREEHGASPVLTTDALVGRQQHQEPTSLHELANDPDLPTSQDSQVGITGGCILDVA